MADRIIIDVVLNTSQARTETATLGRTVKTELDKIEGGARQAGQAIENTGRAAASSTRSMSDGFKGAGAAISGANASLQLMGAQGPPALQTLASAAASVVSSGFGPMAIVLTGVTGLVSLIAALGRESDKTAQSGLQALESSLSRGKDRAEELRLELVKLDAQIGGLRAGHTGARLGQSFERQQLGSEADDIRAALSLLAEIRAAEDPNLPDLNRFRRSRAALLQLQDASPFGSVSGLSVGDSLFTGDSAKAQDALTRRLAQIVSSLARLDAAVTLEAQKAEEEARLRPPGAAGSTSRIGAPSLRGPGPSTGALVSPLRMSGDSKFHDAHADAALRQTIEDEKAAAEEADRFLREIEEKRIEDMARRRALADIEAQRGLAAELQRQQIEVTARSQAEAYSGALSSVLAQSIRSGDFDDFAFGLADATSNALVQALSRAIISATGIEDAAAGLFRSIGTAVAGGIAGGGGGDAAATDAANAEFADIHSPGGPGKMATSQPIYVLTVPDEGVADAMAAKMSASGARAVVAKSSGRGISAGTIPPRRAR